MNMHSTQWHVTISLFENDDHTLARAVLDTGANKISAEGRARHNPHDPVVPQIGEEVAAGRALRALAGLMGQVAAEDIAGVAGTGHTRS